jgi:hypothetical protein
VGSDELDAEEGGVGNIKRKRVTIPVGGSEESLGVTRLPPSSTSLDFSGNRVILKQNHLRLSPFK